MKTILSTVLSTLILSTPAHQSTTNKMPIMLRGNLQVIDTGKELFKKHCSKCHGMNGDKGKFGAKNLQVSKLTGEESKQIIINGKRVMPSWKNKLSSEEINEVALYIKSIQK